MTQKAVWTTITKKMAQEWLQGMEKNRSLSTPIVNRYKRQIESGKWQANGETFKLDTEGRLIDGQHRAMAVIKSGKSIQAWVISGIATDTVATMDCGRKRTGGDMLYMRGITSPTIVAGACRWMIVMKTGLIQNKSRTESPPTEEIETMAMKHPLLQRSARISKGSRGVPQSLLAAVHYCTGVLMDDIVKKPKKDDDETVYTMEDYADAFALTFVRGVTGPFFPSDADPALRWREKLMGDQYKDVNRNVSTASFVYIGTVRCWNNYLAGKTMNRSFIVPNNKELPVIRGLDLGKI